MNLNTSDQDLLDAAIQHLGADTETLLLRYYGSPLDVHEQMEEFHSTGRLQASFAALLRLELTSVLAPPSPTN